jgi:Cu+-exporting ATPase
MTQGETVDPDLQNASERMPYEPSLGCPTCSEGVDPLRAPAVLMTDRGPRYFCSLSCREAYRRADASRPLSVRPLPGDPGLGLRGEELAQILAREPQPERSVVPRESPLSPWPLLLAASAVGLSFVSGTTGGVFTLAVLVAAAFWTALSASVQRREVGRVAWLAAPIGVTLLAAGASLEPSREPLSAAAALGVLLIWAREYLARRAQEPVERLLGELRSRVPASTRLANPDPTLTTPMSSTPALTALLRAGDEVVVGADEVVPVDGVISLGEAQVLPHPGAREQVSRKAGDALLAGARVVEGTLRVSATRVGDARALFRPVSFGLEGSPGSAQVTRTAAWVRSLPAGLSYVSLAGLFALWFARDLSLAVPGLGAALLSFPALSLIRGVTLPFVSASARAASRGMVFRDAVTMERSGRVTAAALCTDGTVTQGTCTLLEVSPLGRDQDHRELTSLALGAELVAEPHPLADAVRRFGAERSIEPAVLRRAAYARGRGVTGLVDGGGALVLGNRQSLLNSGVSVAVADREAQRAESEGRTVLFLSLGGRARGLLIFEDPVRPEARGAVQRLIDLDVEVVLLSGDHRTTVEAVARTLDITHVKAELTNEERAAEVGRLREAGGVVAVIGRAPADELTLSAADIALALEGAGSALEGDVAVASGDLRDAAEALVVARQARRAAQVTLAVALGGGAVLGAAAALGVMHPVFILATALGVDAWALPGAARILRATPARPRVVGRGPLSGLFRRS